MVIESYGTISGFVKSGKMFDTGKHRSSHKRCSIKKAVLKIFGILTGKTCVGASFFNKVADLQACNFIKKKLQHRCFPVNTAKFLRTPILKKICQRRLLKASTKLN